MVVGASEAGLAALERLLLDTHLSFNYLTLLAPGGINVGGLAAQYTAGGWQAKGQGKVPGAGLRDELGQSQQRGWR